MPCPGESRNTPSTPRLRPLPSRRVIPGLPSPSASLALRKIEKIERMGTLSTKPSSSVENEEEETVEIVPDQPPASSSSQKRKLRLLAGSMASEDRKRRWRARGLGAL